MDVEGEVLMWIFTPNLVFMVFSGLLKCGPDLHIAQSMSLGFQDVIQS
jgi:hypothetical protein